MLLASWLGAQRANSSRTKTKRQPGQRPAPRGLCVEALEDRRVLDGSGDYLLIPDFDKNNVLRFDAATGAFVDEFVSQSSGRLNQPWSALIGPHDGNLYVSTGHWRGPGQIKAVLRYDGTTGAFLDEFVQRGQMDMPHAVMFGPDGNLYVGDIVGADVFGFGEGGRIVRFDGTTGAFIDEFVTPLSGGLLHPLAHVFGPSGRGPKNLDLYVTDEDGHDVKRYDGKTGAFKGAFVAASDLISDPFGLTFGPDGNLYVADFGIGAILRFQGPSGKTPGGAMPSAGNSGAVFVAPGSGDLLRPLGVIFGPDGSGDGHQDLYVSNITFTSFYGKDGSVKRYDGLTGAFIDTFVPTRSGGLDDPSLIAFMETDPVTLAYTGEMQIASDGASSTASGDAALLIAFEVTTLCDDRRQASGGEEPVAFTETVRNELILPPEPAPANTAVTRAALASLLSDDDEADSDSDLLIDNDLLTLLTSDL